GFTPRVPWIEVSSSPGCGGSTGGTGSRPIPPDVPGKVFRVFQSVPFPRSDRRRGRVGDGLRSRLPFGVPLLVSRHAPRAVVDGTRSVPAPKKAGTAPSKLLRVGSGGPSAAEPGRGWPSVWRSLYSLCVGRGKSARDGRRNSRSTKDKKIPNKG